jgi:ABC-type branched-subunit amino acid transport system substrate-binding protein
MRLVGLCTGVAVAALVAGCSTTSNSTTTAAATAGGDLTVYASVPSQQADVYSGEKLALTQLGDKVGKYTIVLKQLPAANSVKQITDNARTAIADTSTIAYLGETVPGTSGWSVPITNELGILQVSPTDNALELVEGSPVLPESRKSLYYPSQSTYGYTFGRVVPSATKEAEALVLEMQTLKVTKLYVTSQPLPCTDGDVSGCYGKAIAKAVATDAAQKSIAVSSTPSGADGAFVGTNDPAYAATTFGALRSNDPAIKLFGPSPLDTSAFSPSDERDVYISAPGVMQMPSAFAAAFKAAYGHAPSMQALFGDLAMTALLDALHQASGSADNRTAVTSDFFSLRNKTSPLGSFTINPRTGEIELPTPTIVINRFRGGQLVPFTAPSTLG